jgi:hypothetical protein
VSETQHKEISIIDKILRIISPLCYNILVGVYPGSRPVTGVDQAHSNVNSRRYAGLSTRSIAKFTGTKTIGDSNITEDASGNIGIGTTLPTSQLTVNGVIEMMSAAGGIKFPDGTLQTTAGLPAVSHDATLKGNGTQTSPLGLAVPLTLTGETPQRTSVLVVTQTGANAEGMTVNGGPRGAGVVALGGSGTTIAGAGVIATGGNSLDGTCCAGYGVVAQGGQGSRGGGGIGVFVFGGGSASSGGGTGVYAVGGGSRTAGWSAGTAIRAFGGYGENGPRGPPFYGNVGLSACFQGWRLVQIDHPLDPENKYRIPSSNHGYKHL